MQLPLCIIGIVKLIFSIIRKAMEYFSVFHHKGGGILEDDALVSNYRKKEGRNKNYLII